MAMSGSGVRIYINEVPIRNMNYITLYIRQDQARNGRFVAAAGTAGREVFDQAIVGTTRATGPSTWASALSGTIKFWFFTF